MKTIRNSFFKVLLLILFSGIFVKTQCQDSIRGDGFQKFYYSTGQLSSEGMMKEGKPEGYWKAFYPDGRLKSEGNRLNYELDSTWKFYSERGKLILEVNYRKGKKEGLKISYLDRETIKERYRNDIKEGYTTYYYSDGNIKMVVPFVNGIEQGLGKEHDRDGTIITLTEYNRGFIVDRLRINRKDADGRKQGKWFVFWENGNKRQEGRYHDDKMDGYFKDYAENGDLLKITKYINGVIQPEAEEIMKLEVQNEYYPDGKIKVNAMFRNGIPEGVKREYNSEGKIEKGYIYKNGIIISEGIVKDDGNRDGPWKDLYEDGTLRAEGKYDNGKQAGEWKYFHPNGKLEQIGKFNKNGKPEGTWRWYYDNGKLLKEESYRGGLRDGMATEYDENGGIIEAGEYLNGLEEGSWFEMIGDSYTRGSYRDGLRTGLWLQYYLIDNEQKKDSILSFKGSFTEDLPDGKHYYYWDNGKVKDEGVFVMGKKEGEWLKYNFDGTLFMMTTYKNGVETRYDGVKIKPPFERED